MRKGPGSKRRWPDNHDVDGPGNKEHQPRRTGPKNFGQTRRTLSNGLLSATLALAAVQALAVDLPHPNQPSSPDSSSQARPSPLSTESPRPGASSGPFTLVPLRNLLNGLSIRPEEREGYARSSFKHWIDSDGDGCDTRRDVLIRDAIDPPEIAPPCILVGGAWGSQYDGLAFDDPRRLDVDHVVPLAEASRSGALAWTPDRRMRFANDLEVRWALVAVSAASNRSKRDQDPASWMPSLESARCAYVRMWIQVKARWNLAVDDREFATLRDVVDECEPIDGEYVPAA